MSMPRFTSLTATSCSNCPSARAGEVDRAHAAVAELAHELVGADALADARAGLRRQDRRPLENAAGGGAELAPEPVDGEEPLLVDLGGIPAQRAGDLVDVEPAEVAELDDLAALRVDGGEAVQRLVEAAEVDVAPGAGVVDEETAHRLRHQGEPRPRVEPVLGEAPARLAHERAGLERTVGIALEPPPVVHQRRDRWAHSAIIAVVASLIACSSPRPGRSRRRRRGRSSSPRRRPPRRRARPAGSSADRRASPGSPRPTWCRRGCACRG